MCIPNKTVKVILSSVSDIARRFQKGPLTRSPCKKMHVGANFLMNETGTPYSQSAMYQTMIRQRQTIIKWFPIKVIPLISGLFFILQSNTETPPTTLRHTHIHTHLHKSDYIYTEYRNIFWIDINTNLV